MKIRKKKNKGIIPPEITAQAFGMMLAGPTIQAIGKSIEYLRDRPGEKIVIEITCEKISMIRNGGEDNGNKK